MDPRFRGDDAGVVFCDAIFLKPSLISKILSNMIKLYSYFRSSAAYRVRIALNLKSLAYE